MKPERFRIATLAAALLATGALLPVAGLAVEPPSASASAMTHHVDCAAPPGGDGSITQPWNSTSDVNAHGAFAPGESILFKRGTTCVGRVAPSGSGTSGNPITLGAYGSGLAPEIEGGGTADKTGTIHLVDVHDWTIRDLSVTNDLTTGIDDTYRSGILVENTGAGVLSNITITDNTVAQVVSSFAYTGGIDPHMYGGISVIGWATATDSFNNILIGGNTVENVGRSGIVVWNHHRDTEDITHVRITDNVVSHSQGDSILVWDVNGGLIDHNVSANAADKPEGVGPQASAGIWPVASHAIVMEYNEAYGTKMDIDGEGFDIDGDMTNVIAQYNYSHDNEGGGFLFCGPTGAIMRYNVLEDNGDEAIDFSCRGVLGGAHIHNNVIYIPPGSAADVAEGAAGAGTGTIRFDNNIVYNHGSSGAYSWPAEVEASHNTFFGNHHPSEPVDPFKLTSDPGLVAPGTGGFGIDSVDGYRAAPGSPSLGTGGPIGEPALVDYFGNVIDPSAPSRGPFASATGVLPPTAPEAVYAVRTGSTDSITWTAAENAQHYNLLQSTSPDGPFTTIATGILSNDYQNQGLELGVQYYYRVSAWNIAGTGPASSSASTDDIAVGAAVSASSTLDGYGFSLASLTNGTLNSISGNMNAQPNDAGYTSDNAPGIDHTEWVQLQLSSGQEISAVTLFPRNGFRYVGQGFPVDYTVEVSPDGSTWSTVATRTGAPRPSGPETVAFAPTTAQYVRITGTALRVNPDDGNSYRMQFAEIGVHPSAAE